MRLRNTSGVAVAAAAAMLFGTGLISNAVAQGTDATIHCKGVNACKGQSACKSAHNACKGQNSCKGKGFLEMTKADCKAAKEKMKSEGAAQ
jgi:hypothetical protein